MKEFWSANNETIMGKYKGPVYITERGKVDV